MKKNLQFDLGFHQILLIAKWLLYQKSKYVFPLYLHLKVTDLFNFIFDRQKEKENSVVKKQIPEKM